MKAALITTLVLGIGSAAHAQVQSPSQNPLVTTPPSINPSVPMTTAPVPGSPGAAMTMPGNATTTQGTSATGMRLTTSPTGGNGSSNTGAVRESSTSSASSGGLQGGAGSFTEGQAKSRLDSAGYANITDMVKDKDGIWHGRAMRRGSPVEVAVDFKGNVVAR